jgi:hypothetical protein
MQLATITKYWLDYFGTTNKAQLLVVLSLAEKSMLWKAM